VGYDNVVHKIDNSALTVAGVVGPVISCAITAFRLIQRSWTRRFSYDDCWAAISMLLMMLFASAISIHLHDSGEDSVSGDLTVGMLTNVCAAELSHTTRVALVYILSEDFYGVLWYVLKLLRKFRISIIQDC
jgi:hypothetical protein